MLRPRWPRWMGLHGVGDKTDVARVYTVTGQVQQNLTWSTSCLQAGQCAVEVVDKGAYNFWLSDGMVLQQPITLGTWVCVQYYARAPGHRGRGCHQQASPDSLGSGGRC